MSGNIWQSSFVRYARRTPSFQWGLALVIFWILVIPLAPVLAPYGPTEPHPYESLNPPSSKYWFGTDKDGMDIFSRTLYASWVDLGIAISNTAISFVLGVLIGTLAGYFIGSGGFLGLPAEWTMRAVDIVQAFPVFIFALVLVAVLGASITNVILAQIFINTPAFIWLTRSEVLSVRERTFIEAARCSGNSEVRIALTHTMLNSLASSLTFVSVILGQSVLLTAGLSFVGAGVRVPTPEWGLMVSQGASTMITGQWWVSVFPGLALGSAVFGFALVGDGLRNYMDPKRRDVGVRGVAPVVPAPQA